MDALKRIPPIVWGFVVPALIIGAVQLNRPDGRRVHVTGGGYVHGLTVEDEASEAYFYELDTREAESIDDTIARTRALLQHFPRVIVVGFDVAAIESSAEAEAKLKMRELVRKLESNQVVPVVLPPRATAGAPAELEQRAEALSPWFTTTMCKTSKLRICVRWPDGPTPPSRWKQDLAEAVERAVKLHSTLPASKIGH